MNCTFETEENLAQFFELYPIEDQPDISFMYITAALLLAF